MVSMTRELTNMPQLEHIEAIEKRLWAAADMVCNPRGYAPKALNPDFRTDWVVEA